jgi:hypothetical protein
VVTAIGRITHAAEPTIKKLEKDLLAIAQKKTEQADLQFDQDGKAIKPGEEEKADENTIIVERPAGSEGSSGSGSPA